MDTNPKGRLFLVSSFLFISLFQVPTSSSISTVLAPWLSDPNSVNSLRYFNYLTLFTYSSVSISPHAKILRNTFGCSTRTHLLPLPRDNTVPRISARRKPMHAKLSRTGRTHASSPLAPMRPAPDPKPHACRQHESALDVAREATNE
ncbi:hypothetical protein B0H11DRAFT_1900608 [Mycena galericulata]|nr:hypothetical protein B0H11DRAFT_1900608 [Mycena galericulata]